LLSIWIPIGSRFRHRSASSLSHRSLCPTSLSISDVYHFQSSIIRYSNLLSHFLC
jgi:hypothetical protein